MIYPARVKSRLLGMKANNIKMAPQIKDHVLFDKCFLITYTSPLHAVICMQSQIRHLPA